MANENLLFVQVWGGVGFIVGIIISIIDEDVKTVGDLLVAISLCMTLGPVSLYFLVEPFIKPILNIKIKN